MAAPAEKAGVSESEPVFAEVPRGKDGHGMSLLPFVPKLDEFELHALSEGTGRNRLQPQSIEVGRFSLMCNRRTARRHLFNEITAETNDDNDLLDTTKIELSQGMVDDGFLADLDQHLKKVKSKDVYT